MMYILLLPVLLFLTPLFLVSNDSHNRMTHSTMHHNKLQALENMNMDPDIAQRQIRLHVKDKTPIFLGLFQEALKKKQLNSQIHIANAYAAHLWSYDDTKDFSSITSIDMLDSYRFAQSSFQSLQCIYQIIEPLYNQCAQYARAKKVFCEAARKGNYFALVVSIMHFKTYSPSHFGTACKLKKMLEAGITSREIKFAFGSILFRLGMLHSQFFLEGVRYLRNSGGLYCFFFDDIPSMEYDNFTQYCNAYTYPIGPCYKDIYGIRFIENGNVLCPSRTVWEDFQKRIQRRVKIPHSVFNLYSKFDMKTIYNIYKEHQISLVSESPYPSLAIYSKDVLCATFFVENPCLKSKKILTHYPIEKNDLLDPLFKLCRKVLERCTDSLSAKCIIEDLEFDEEVREALTLYS